MFSPSPLTDRLQAGPTTGAFDSNPAERIPIDGLTIPQVASLQAQLNQKHPLFGLGDLTL